MNGIAEEDGMANEGKTTLGPGIDALSATDPLGVIHGGGVMNDGAKPAEADETGTDGYMVPRNAGGMSEADLADMASVADPLGTMRLREATLGLGLDKPKPAPAKPRDPNAPMDGETAEDWINRVRDVAARNDRDARMDYEMVTFLQNRAKDGTTDEEVFKYLDEYSEKRWGLHCDHGSAWNPDDGMHPFESAGDYADAMQRIVRDGWASPVSPSLRAWREAQARGDRAEMIRLAGVLPNKVEGAVFGANGVGGGEAVRGATTRPKTDAEIDEELDEYDAKMAAKDFLGVQRVLDAKWHFDERERRLINAAIDSGDGLPDEAREDFEALAYAAPERAAAVGMLVDLARRRESRWVRDNVVDPICSVAKDFFKGAVAMERGAAESVMLRAEANAMVRDEAEGGDMDYSPRRIWNERERGEYDRIAATGNLRDAYLTAKKMCVERLVDEMKPAAESRRERLTRTLVEDAVGHQPTVEYNYLSRSVAGVCSMLPYMALSATPAGFALNVASQFEKVRDDIVRGGGDPDEALGAQLLLATAWAGVEKLQYERLLGRPMSGLRMRMTFANGFCEAWKRKEFREALRRAGTLARQVAKEGAKKGATESLEESVQDALEKGEVTWFTTKDGGKAFADAVKAGATSFCESYLSMAMVGGFDEAKNLYRARNASLDNRSLAEFASAENRAMQLYRGNLAELEGTAEQREKNLTERTRKFREECLATVRRHREDGGGLREALAEIRERNGLTDEQTRSIGEWLDMRANVQAMAANTGARERSRLLHGAGMLPIGQDTTYDVANLMRLINPDIKVEEVTLGGEAAPETATPPAAKDGAPSAAHPATPTAPIETAKPRMLSNGESVETKALRERLAEAERNVANAPDKKTRRKADKEARRLRQKLRSSEAADAAEEKRQGEQANAAPTTEAVPGETEGTTPATPPAEPATLSPEAVGETATPPAAPQGTTATPEPETPSAPVEGTPTPVAEPPPSPTATEPRRGLRITVPLADGTTRSVTLVENHEAPDINTEGAATSVAAAMADMVGATNRAGQTVRGADEITDEEFAALPADKKTAFAVTEKRYMAMGEDERALYWDNNNLTDGGYFMPATAGNAYGSDGVIMVQRSLGSPFARVGGNWTVSHEYGHAVSRFMRDAGLIGERQTAVLQALFPKRGGSEADELWDEEAANNAFAEWLRNRFDFGLVPEGQREEVEGIFKIAWRVIKTLLGLGGREAPVMERERTRREEAIDAMAEAFRKGDFSGLDAFAEDVDALREKPGAKPAEAAVAEDGAANAEAVAPHADTPATEAAQNAAGERGAEPRTTTPTDGAKPAEGGKSRPMAKPAAKTDAEAEKEAYRRGYEDALAKATADFLAKVAADPEHAKDNLPNRTGARRTLFTPNYAMKVEVEYTWAPLASILESTDDREMQMRDRKNRIATAQQVIENTRPGRFQPLALFMSLTTDTGAPIVGRGMRIISGHGRHQYLLKLDEEGRFGEYLGPINAECARQGLPTAPQGMEKPVLVARVVKGLETIEQAHRFAELSNRSGMLERSGAEYAESDARAITPSLMRLYNPDESGNLLSAGNRDFMNAFIRAVGATGLTNADGTPTPEAALRVQRAMMTAIFGGDENVRAMVRQLLEQSQALGLGTVMNALTRSAGRLLALRGRHGDFDIVDDVREATRLYIAWRVAKLEQPRLTFAEHLRGQDLFQNNATPMQEALARLLDTGRFGAALAKYVDLAAQEAEDGQGLLGGIVEKRTPLQVMGYAERAILPLKDGATEARTDEDYAEAPVTPHPDGDVAKSAVKVATPPVETKPLETKPAEPAEPAPAEPVKPAAPPAPKPKPAAKKPEPAKPEPTPAEAAAAIVEEDVKPHPFTPQPAKPQSLAPAKHGEKFAFERDGEKTTLPGGAWNHLRVPFKYGRDKGGNALPIPTSPQDGRGRGLWAPSYPWGAKDRARRDALLAQWGGRCPKYMGNKNSMTLRTVAAIHDQMSPEERAHYTALNDCFGGGGCWGLTLAMTCFTNVRRITVNEFEEGRLEKIRLMHTLDGEMKDRLRAFLERTDLVEKARKVVLVSADGKVRKATWNGQDCRDRTFAAAREFMDELTADERGLLFALLDNMQSRMQYGAGELVDGKYDFDTMVEAAVSGVAKEAVAATEMADAFKARGGSIVYVAGDSKLQKSFGARRDTKRTDAEVYTRGGDGDAYAVEHGDHVVSVCDPPYYRTTGYDNGNKTTVGLAENPMGWGYEDTRAMLRAVVDGGDALVYTDEAWWLNSEYRAETDEGDFMEGDLFGGALGPTSVYARENAVLQDIVNLLDHFDVAGGVASRQEVLGVHHGHSNDHQSADGAVLRAADDAAGGGLPADGGRVHGRDDQAVGAVDGGDAAQDGAAHGQDAQGDGRGGSGEADAAAGGRHSVRVGAGTAALARAVLARELADEIQREKPHLPRAVAHGAARYAIRARYEAASGAARHSIFSTDEPNSWREENEPNIPRYRTMLRDGFGNRYTNRAREEIYAKTGWWRGVDGLWRIEVPDIKRKTTAGKTKTLPDGRKLVNGFIEKEVNGEKVYGCTIADIAEADILEDIVSNVTRAPIVLVRPEASMDGQTAYFESRFEFPTYIEAIVLSDALFDKKNGAPATLTERGERSLVHEVQHLMQRIDDTAYGASPSLHGQFNYWRSAGEVEARNAARRNTNEDDALADLANAYGSAGEPLRRRAMAEGRAPWQTEDVPKKWQIITDYHGKAHDQRGRIVHKMDAPTAEMAEEIRRSLEADARKAATPRHSVTVGDVFDTGAGDGVEIPVSSLRTYKNEPGKSILNAARFMAEAMDGGRGKRKPINVADNGDGTYTVVDGTATSKVLAAVGAANAYAKVVGPNRGTRLLNSVYTVENVKPEGGVLRTENAETLDEAIAQAAENADALADLCRAAAAKVGGEVMLRKTNPETGKPTKKRASAERKLRDEYDGDVSRLIDLVGGTVVIGDNGDFGDALKAIKRNLPEGASLGRVKVFHLAPTDRGYGDIKVSVRFANGGVGEIILVGRGMFEGKEMRGGHEVYNIRRVLEKYKGMDAEVNEACDALDKLSNAVYATGADAPDAANFASIKARASSSITCLLGPNVQSRYSSSDMEAVKSMVDGLNLAYPPSQNSNATPALSLMKNMDASLVDAVRETISRPTRDSVAYPGGGAQGESAGRRDSADAERHSIHVGWRSDFPKAVCMTTRTSLMAKHGDDFSKAKAGDREAAARLVEAVSKPDKIKALVAAHPNASIVCPVHAEEATGRNKIPVMFAQYIASVTGIECDDRIVQTVRANHTGSNAAHRLFVSPEFDGEVKKGAEYIVVDDHITQGGTVNALRDHIESHGGKVVAIASLTLSQGSSTLAPTQETIDAVRRKHEGIDQTLKALGIADGVECLTQSECRYLASLSPDGLRDRIAASRPEGDGGLGEGAVREEVAPANERERHSLIVSVPTSGVRLRAKSEAQRLLDEKFHGEYTDEARERIYAATGWWKSVDGKWRIEIPNPTARTKISKKRTVPKSLRGNWECVNGLYVNRDRDEYHCRFEDMVDFPSGLVSAFPIIPSINVRIVNGDGDEMAGKYAFWDGRGIALNWDLVEWHDDEPTTIPTEQGVATLTHELQHVIQDYSGFASGASANVHGKWNYAHSAGEVEARNAERRRTDTTDEDGNASIFNDLATDFTMDGQDANGDLREEAIETGNAPWQTEDVPTDEQVITKWDAKRGPITTDRMGNLVPRHSVTAGRGGGMRRQDMAVAFLAQRVLAGREATVDEASAVLKSLGLGALPAGETLAKAKKVAEDNRARLKKETEESSPKVFATLAAANLAEDMGVALDRLITRSSEAVDPEVGRRVQKMAHDHEARSLAAANGFTAAEMAAEMPIDLAQGLLAVKEYEKTPEEKARLEAERAKREEERRRRMEEDDRTDEEMLADAEADHLREPTAEERAAFDALMDRARFADEQRKAEEQRRKLADAQRKRSGADGAAEDADGGGEGDGADGADAIEAGTLSKETVARIAPVFESAELFAQFLIEWTSDKTLERHPELPATAQMWKSPVAVRELKQTATAILRDLARRALGTPMHNHARNYADHLINELESDAQLKTYASVRRMVARVYGVIHDDALRLTRRQLVDRLVNGWREGETTHMGIKQLAGVKGRFSATAEAAQRAIDGRTEQWARTLVKVIYLSEAKTAQREQELEAIVNFDPTAEDAGDAPTPDAVREAADELAIIRRYGGLRRMMPGQISELSDEILDLLGGKRQAFEAERLEREAKCAKVREAFIAAVGAGRAPKPKGKKNFLVRWLEAFQGNVDLEMRSLYRHCADEAKRQAASDAVDELMVAISEAGSVYRTEAARGRAEVQRGLAAAYGSAESGIKHLAEPLPTEVADAVFSQSRDLVPTYGHLLQLYASAIQKDYAENVKKHGRDKQLALMRSTLTAGDMAFHAWAAQWYAAGRARLSDAVEAVTGVPVTSPDNCYVPVRVKRPAQGFAAEVSAWSPIPRALSKRVPHALDFDEGADFLSLLLEQVETRAQTIGKAGLGIELRDTLAHRDVQDAVRRSVGAEEMRQVADHLRDIVMEDVGRDRDRTLDLLDLARGWVARFGISGNLKSVMSQPASIPVWGNVMLGGRSIGLGRVAYYLAHVDRDAIAELVESDGFSARYEMGWSEEVQNILKNPSRNRVIRSVERVYDIGMKPSQYADRCATLWVAQGFYRDARQRYLDMGETEAEAKRKALALTWAAVEATQQTGRTEYMNRAQRGRSGSIARAVFQFRTAQLLSNNYLIQALRDAKAGTPGAKGRLARAAVISTVVVPAYMMAVSALWDALMGEEPPEDEERWPTLMKEMAWSMVDGVTAPLFVANTLAESTVKPLLGIGGFGSGSGIPALDSTKRLAVHAGKAAKDAAAWLGQNLGAFELEEEMTLDKIMADLGRLAQDAAAPVRQTARALRNWLGREE